MNPVLVIWMITVTTAVVCIWQLMQRRQIELSEILRQYAKDRQALAMKKKKRQRMAKTIAQTAEKNSGVAVADVTSSDVQPTAQPAENRETVHQS